MSLPRPIDPGASYLLTRRVTQRQFLLRPDPLTELIVLYALAYAVQVSGVLVHAVVVMSNHIHLVVTDPNGSLPKFLQTLHRHIACCMNATLGRRENFWSSTGASAVSLESDFDVLDKIAYVLANPTTAGLVEDPSQWPGVIAPPEGMHVTAQRPPVFYDPKGDMPSSIELTIAPPPSTGHATVEALVAHLRELVGERVTAAKVKFASFLGREAVLATNRLDRALTPEPFGSLRPLFAARAPADRCRALTRLRGFRERYRRAMEGWRAGDRDVVFPAGTYGMRVQHGVRVESVPDAATAPGPSVAAPAPNTGYTGSAGWRSTGT